MGFDSEKSFVMAERLKQLREGKGLSHEKLSKALFEQYGVKISSDSLINYEVADANHTKALKNQGMRVEYLRCLADFYGVSANYLLGLTGIKSPNCDIQAAVQYTGLSEESIRLLHFDKEVGLNDATLSIDRLLLDYRNRNVDAANNRYYRPVLNLLNYFFNYSNSGITKQIYLNGTITDLRINGFISTDAIVLNDIVIENAVLAEIQQALASLKRNLAELEK